MKLELGVGSGLDGDVDDDEELKIVEEGSGLVQFMKWKNLIFFLWVFGGMSHWEGGVIFGGTLHLGVCHIGGGVSYLGGPCNDNLQ